MEPNQNHLFFCDFLLILWSTMEIETADFQGCIYVYKKKYCKKITLKIVHIRIIAMFVHPSVKAGQ